jgi:hypothetical protein
LPPEIFARRSASHRKVPARRSPGLCRPRQVRANSRFVAAAVLLLVGAAVSWAQEFRIDNWRAQALVGPASLQENVQYVAFSGHHGLYNWVPNEQDLAAYVEKDASLLSRFQLRVINLGVPLPGLSGTPLARRIDEAMLYSLRAAGYDLASRANNHALDLGSEGARYYEQKLESAGLRIVGQRGFPVYHWRAGDRRIDICAVADVLDRPDPDNLILKINDADLALLRKETEGADFRIALTHLGSASRFPSPHERKQVRRVLQAGFDLVVGTGSHFIKGFLFEDKRPVAYGIGDHLLSVQYDPEAGVEPLGMHLVAGFQDGRLVQIFVVPFHNDLRRGRLGPLEETAFDEFVKTLRERSSADESRYYSDGGTLKMMLRAVGNMGPADWKRLRPRHVLYGAKLVIRQRPEWAVGAGLLVAALAVMLLRWRSSRQRRNEGRA